MIPDIAATDAVAPAAPQAPQPTEVDHSIEGAARAFDDIFKKSAAPRAPDGKFAPGQQAPEPAAPEPEPEAEAEPNAAPEGEDEPAERFKIQLDDGEVEMSPEEIRDAVKAARTKREPDVETIKQRHELEIEKQNIQRERQHYEMQLRNFIPAAQAQLQAEFSDLKTMQDVQRLAAEDPARYVKWQAGQNAIAAAQAEQQQLAQRARYDDDVRRNQILTSEAEKLKKADPVFASPDKAEAEFQAIRSYLNKRGYSADELSQLTDHRTVLVARKAMLYDKMMSAKPTEKRVPPAVTRVVRPGSAPTNSAAASAQASRAAAQTKLKETGSIDALADAFRAMGVR